MQKVSIINNQSIFSIDLQPSCYYQEIEYHKNDPPHRVLLSLGVSLDLPLAVEVSIICCIIHYIAWYI